MAFSKILFLLISYTILVSGQSSTSTLVLPNYIFLGTAPYTNSLTVLDGPAYITEAPSSTQTIQPDPSLINYYNYFAASVYCGSSIQNLSCDTCQHFNSDVTYHTILKNETLVTLALITVHSVKKEIVVTFRGSSNAPNFVLDFVFLDVDYAPGVKIHTGFYICTMSLYSRV
jgi:hypothetical protein